MNDMMETSILKSIKKVLGLSEDYNAFDQDILMHINTAFFSLQQLGVGPKQGFVVDSDDMTWSAFLPDEDLFQAVKSYIYIRVKMLFDPPQFGHAQQSLEQQRQELEWRLCSQTKELPNV